MTSNNQIEFKGLLERHPAFELIVEFSQKRLTGSLRLSSDLKKSIVYFEDGEIVFAVSNARRHRLFQVLLDHDQIDKKTLSGVEEFTNDIHLAKTLVEDGSFNKAAMDSIFVHQFRSILSDAFEWEKGEFLFSASARIKSGIHFDFDLRAPINSYLESMDPMRMTQRLSNQEETFGLNKTADFDSANLNPQDAFILSRLGGAPMSADLLGSMCGLDQDTLKHAIYRLWITGFVKRFNWSSAISLEETEKLAGKSFELKTSARSFEEDLARAAKEAEEKAKEDAIRAEEERKSSGERTLEEYLDNIENAATHYEIFNISPDSKLSVIKKAYFSLAKQFHPDHFYRNVDEETHKRIQQAFTETAQAYETLKDAESREVYDFKLRKVIEQLREAESGPESRLSNEDLEATGQASRAKENFDTGYEYLLNDKIEQATPYLARAAHIENGNARYRAFYGRALTFDRQKQRKAESELQTAIKIEPKNSHYRLMLAELFVEIGHTVRAKAELQRLLKMDANNKEARRLLDSLED